MKSPMQGHLQMKRMMYKSTPYLWHWYLHTFGSPLCEPHAAAMQPCAAFVTLDPETIVVLCVWNITSDTAHAVNALLRQVVPSLVVLLIYKMQKLTYVPAACFSAGYIALQDKPLEV